MESAENPNLDVEKNRYIAGNPRKPLVCSICDDYYRDPCLLSCYHTFCSRCLEDKADNGIIHCPICGAKTEFEGKLPTDVLIKKLVDLFNLDNPPCANCDKRERTTMFFCSTCNQALCHICRENTHRAKMFSTHDVLPMSKFSQEGIKKCNIHGEQYVMYSLSQNLMLCINCFRDMPAEGRQHCLDVETAYTQLVMKLETVIGAICETQNTIREGIILSRSQLDELLHNTDAEKMTVHSFTQGLQDAINKTQSAILMEIQRQYELKERSFRSQLISLTTLLPVMQQHIMLCQGFSSTANKYQFLEVVSPMHDRLSMVSHLPRMIRPTLSSQIRTNYRSEFAHCLEPWVGRLLASSVQQTHESIYETTTPYKQQTVYGIPTLGGPPSFRQQSALKAKALEGDGPFSNHCRSFYNQVKELGLSLKNIKERIGELHRDISILHRTATPPLVLRHQVITQDCARLSENLEQIQVELERLKTVFQSIWQEQLYRIHVEQDIFQQQMNDIVSLRSEVKQLAAAAQNLEPQVSQLSAQGDTQEIAKLKSLLSEISQLKDTQRLRSDRECKIGKALSRKSACQSSVSLSAETKSLVGDDCKRDTLRSERAYSVSEQKNTRGVFSQLMDKVRTKDKSQATESFKIRSKSEDRLKECSSQVCPKSYSACEYCSEGTARTKQKRVSSFYSTFGGFKNSTKEVCENQKGGDAGERKDEYQADLPHIQNQQKELENSSEYRWKESSSFKGTSGNDKKESDYQSISEATSSFQPICNYYSSDEDDFCRVGKQQPTKPNKKSAPPSPPPRRIKHRRYPHSDPEETTVLYADTIKSHRRQGSTIEDGKAFLLVIGGGKSDKSVRRMQKQRSWETFPPKRKASEAPAVYSKNPNNYKSQFDVVALQTQTVKKSDSFEGHEEAVSSLVREFQKARMMQKQQTQGYSNE